MSLSRELRIATEAAHRRVERHAFFRSLLKGQLAPDDYAAYLIRLVPAYEALESSAVLRKRIPPALFASLERAPALRADLSSLGHNFPMRPVPVANRYANYLRDLEADRSWRLISHAYTRYLGDLSGGQVVARLLQKHLRLGPKSLSFYCFAEDSKNLASDFRQALDNLQLGSDERLDIVDEACRAFDWTEALVDDLASALPAGLP